MVEEPHEEDHPIDWEKSVVVTIALGAGIVVILALATLVAMALLAPTIGNVFSGGGPSL